jgi:lipopolysaccharide transport system ATP-binding protein
LRGFRKHAKGFPMSSNDVAIRVQNLAKCYQLYAAPRDRLKQFAVPRLQRLLGQEARQYFREFWALRDISFEVKRGEALGIIGKNGSGKSTLLQIIAGTLTPTNGEVQVNGRVAALLELGSGFNPEFTGRENVYLNGSILGFTRDQMDHRIEEIAAFADIGQFMDQPVKHYSSGMFVRLAFAVQACVEPDILIIDEALSVGDIFFQQKCHARMEELLAGDTALLFVSHDMGAIEKYCSTALLLNHGQTSFYGKPSLAVARYYYSKQTLKPVCETRDIVQSSSQKTDNTERINHISLNDWPPASHYTDMSNAVVVGEAQAARCTAVALCNQAGNSCKTFEIGESAIFYYEFEITQNIFVPVGGVTIFTNKNIPIHAKNSLQQRVKAPSVVRKGSRIRFRQRIKLDLMVGAYIFNIGLGTIDSYYYERTEVVDYSALDKNYLKIIGIVNAGAFDIVPKTHGVSLPFYGYVDLDGDCNLEVID